MRLKCDVILALLWAFLFIMLLVGGTVVGRSVEWVSWKYDTKRTLPLREEGPPMQLLEHPSLRRHQG